VLAKQCDELSGWLERVGDHREVIRGHGDPELAPDLGEHERLAWNRRAVQRGEADDRQLVVAGSGSDGDYWGIERGHVIKTRAAEV
jgi:hypothetical protein